MSEAETTKRKHTVRTRAERLAAQRENERAGAERDVAKLAERRDKAFAAYGLARDAHDKAVKELATLFDRDPVMEAVVNDVVNRGWPEGAHVGVDVGEPDEG